MHIVILALSSLLVVSAKTALASDLWEPPHRPSVCGRVAVDDYALDLSGSMQAKGLLDNLKKQIVPDIAASPPCLLVIIAGFGVTFDVIDSGFANDPNVTDRLVTVVNRLKAGQPQTNLDEAAKGIEWVHSRLERAYGESFTHKVRVLTDDVAAPSPGKEAFSIAAYFKKLGGSDRMTVVEAQLDADGAHLGSSRNLNQGEFKVVRLEDVMAAMRTLSQPSPAAGAPSLAPATGGEPSKHSQGHPWVLAGVAALVVLIGGGAWAATAQRNAQSPSLAAPEPVPAELHIQEYEFPEEGHAGQSPKLRQDAHVAVRMNMPVRFGRDALRYQFVVSDQKGLPNDEVVRLTLMPGQVAEVRGAKGLRIGGRPMEEETVRVSTQQPIAMRLGRLEWRVVALPKSSINAGMRLFAPANK